ncbi:MAG: class I SAM-dependent methyltransferase, partial [Jatrophihabitantaceae bacterium]
MSRAALDKKPQDVAAMFDGVARRYDLTNTVLSMGKDRRWRRRTRQCLELTPGQR